MAVPGRPVEVLMATAGAGAGAGQSLPRGAEPDGTDHRPMARARATSNDPAMAQTPVHTPRSRTSEVAVNADRSRAPWRWRRVPTTCARHRARTSLASRLIAVLAALVLAGGVAACSPLRPLTDDEWAWCQDNWRAGLDPTQRAEPNGSTWYFNHMGFPGDPDTIRVCRAAAAKR